MNVDGSQDGTGTYGTDDEGLVRCPDCDGEGWRYESRMSSRMRECDLCLGEGNLELDNDCAEDHR